MTTPLHPDSSGDNVGGSKRKSSGDSSGGGTVMSAAIIESFLAQQTSPTSGAGERSVNRKPLWKRALDEQTTQRAYLSFRSTIPWRWLQMGGLAAAVLLVVGVILMPAMGKARGSARSLRASAAPTSSRPADAGIFNAPVRDAADSSGGVSGQVTPSAQSADRVIIRKDTVMIEATDVGAAFAKATTLINEAAGEYIEDARQTGRAPYNSAQLTLRVGALRVGEVLVQLGALGTIVEQSTTGTDVTDQVVDLEARLRNERRIEIELLELMTARPDAPLKDVLEVRDSLARVRNEIERMVGHQQRLSRLASLATIVISISTEPNITPKKPPNVLADFQREARGAWRTGLSGLASTVGFIIAVAVGGAIFWAGLIVIITVVVLVRRSQLRHAAQEKAPGV